MNETRASFAIFLIGVLLGSVAFDIPISNYWVAGPMYLATEFSIFDAFTKPFTATLYFFYTYRPMETILWKFLYTFFGLNPIIYIFKSVFLGIFGVAVYRFFLLLSPQRKIESLLASLFSMLSFPVLYSTYKFVFHPDVISSALLFIGLIFFVKLGNFQNKSKNFQPTVLFFLLAYILSLLFKEPSLVFLPLVISLYSLFYAKKINKLQFFALASAILIMFSFIAIAKSLVPPIDKLPMTFYHIGFLVLMNLIQFGFSLLPWGILLLGIYSISFFWKKAILATFPIFILLFLMPVNFSLFDYFGLVFFSQDSLIPFLLISLLPLFLLLIFYKGGPTDRFCSISALGMLFITIIGTILFPSVREDTSTRVFISSLPFLFYLNSSSIIKFFDFIKDVKLQAFFIFIVGISASYFFIVSYFNMIEDYNAISNIDYESNLFLSQLNHSKNTIFYIDPVYPVEKYGVYAITKKMLNNSRFFFLNSINPDNSTETIEKEICVKSQPYDDIFIYIAERKIRDRGSIKGNFLWTTKDSIALLTPTEKTFFYLPNYYGVAEYYEILIFSNETILDNFLKNKKSSLLFNTTEKVYQIPLWSGQTIKRLFSGMPGKIEYDYTGKIYYLNATSLKCDNWYYEEQHENRSFRWMSQNATLQIYNKNKIDELVKLKFSVGSFHKQRTLNLYVNDVEVAEYKVEEGLLINEFMTPLIKLKPGKNTINFYSDEGCDIPEIVGEWNYDSRCLSFSISTLFILSEKDINQHFLLGEGWYKKEFFTALSWRWTSQNTTLYFYNKDKKTASIDIDGLVLSYLRNRTMEVYANDRIINILNIPTTGTEFSIQSINLTEGDNKIVFHSKEGCDIPKDVENTTDTRCLSLNFISLFAKLNKNEFVSII